MSVLNICNCVLRIKDQLGNAYSTAELTVESRKSQVNVSDAIYINRIKRSQAQPGKVIQDLIYIAKSTPTSDITVQYNTGGTAGSEVVSVTGNAITVTMQSGVSTAVQIQTAINNSAAASALAYCLISGTSSNTQTSTSIQTLSDDYCYIPLTETTTNTQSTIFTLNWNDGSDYGSIIFDPIYIPNTSYQDLSSLLTVSRG